MKSYNRVCKCVVELLMADLSNVRVDGTRLWDSLMEMAKIGATPKGGVKRLTLTDLDRQSRQLFRKWCEAAGCTVTVDEMGNMFARRPGEDNTPAPVMVGSHLDTQPTGGKFDGALGVLGALEVVRSLNDLNIRTRRPIEVANWTNEEGSRYAPAMISSGVFAGVYTKEFAYACKDAEGKALGDELERIGFKGEEPVGKHPVHAFFELHIEQGPILEDESIDVGVVTHGQGQRWYEIRLTGFESHAGSTPMPRRKDALLGAARIVELVNAIGLSKAPLGVSTVGMLNPYPNSRNVIPGEVFMTCEFRHPDDKTLSEMDAALREGVESITKKIGLTCDLKQIVYYPPVPFDPGCVEAVRRAAKHFGYSHRDIVSGAGHDACYLARVAPTSMVFTPCVDGISHNESEAIKPVGEGLRGDSTLDANGCFVMPGGVDPHTHLDMPFMGANSADNYESGTKAALSGGTTMVVDFCIPTRNPNQPLMEAFADWQKRSKDAVSDYSYHMCITYWDDSVREDMAKVVKAGVTTFKHFMAYKGALMVDDEQMFASFTRCAELGAMPLVHAENGEVVAALQKHYLAKGITGPEGHALSRPPAVEGEAANRAIMLADEAGVPLYIVHTSCIESHEAIRRARALGKRVYGEPLIQHLVLDESEYYNPDWKHAARRVMSPPFRDKIHQDDLWNGLRAGSLQVVATDHCAFTTKQKELGLTDFTKIPNGTGGLEDRMPVLWTYGVDTGRLTMNEFVAVTSTNIARILNLYPRKGAILPGADADVTVWDPKASKTISARSQVSAIDYNVFEGTKATGLPRYTLSRGEVVSRDGSVQAELGRGRFIKREPFPAEARALKRHKEYTAVAGVAR